ncbi:hypothetical protein [Halobaculum sp. MBLA0143]|uniref:hypothetical protein n=1 Tax=Halobaculum sp. MBLA0143 TaxID=3079933 RepID=UPI0035247AC9
MTETEPDDTRVETSGEESTNPVDASSTYERLRRLVDYLLLFGLALVALVTAVQTYTAVDTLIRRFVSDEFRPVVRGGFNLALLLAAVAGVGLQLRRLR